MAKNVSTQRKEYIKRAKVWQRVRDCLDGEECVKGKKTIYLPKPPGFECNNGSDERYNFYLSFAEFPDILGHTLAILQGLIHEKSPDIELPPKMEYLLDSATPDGKSIYQLWEHATAEVLATGRMALFREIVGDEIKLAPYCAESMVNWLEGRFVVFEENKTVQGSGDFEVEEVCEHRALRLDEETGIFYVQLYRDNVKVSEDVVPVYFGKPLSEIPVDVINAGSHGYEFGAIPLKPLSDRLISIYRKTADYFRSLYNKSEPQTVISGVAESEMPDHIGGGSVWVFQNAEAKAEYLDIDGNGIPLMREAINDQYDRFSQEGGRLLDVGNAKESAEAVGKRQRMSQINIVSIAKKVGEGFEASLKKIAETMGLNPDEVKFQAYLDFSSSAMSGKDLLDLVMAKNQGAPISNKSIHAIMKSRRLTSMEFDDEVDEASTDAPVGLIPNEQPEISG